jgi:hypothetical protein
MCCCSQLKLLTDLASTPPTRPPPHVWSQQVWPNQDYVVGYSVWRDSVTATVHVEPPQPDMDEQGSFALAITPPGQWRRSADLHLTPMKA